MSLRLDKTQIAGFRAQFTDVAARLFLEQGEAGVTMRSLAQAAGVSRTTPYTYFKSKNDILDAVRAVGFRRLTARYREELKKESDPLRRLRATARAYVSFAVDEPAMYDLMFRRPAEAAARHGELNAAVREFTQVAEMPVKACLDAKLIHGDIEDIMHATWSAFHGLVSLYLAGHFTDRRLETLVEVISDTFRHGVLAPQADNRPSRNKRSRRRS